MVTEANPAKRRKSVAASSQNEPVRPKRKRRAHSTAPEELSPFTRSRLSLGPVKGILKATMGIFRAQPEAQPQSAGGNPIEFPSSAGQDDTNATQSMDITQDYQARIHDNFTRKSMGRRVSFSEHTYVRRFKVDNNNTVSSTSTASPQSPSGNSSDDDSPPRATVTNENDYSGAFRRRSSARYSMANSDMDLTTVMDAEGAGSDLHADLDDDMEVTEAIEGNLRRRRSLSMAQGRKPLSEVPIPQNPDESQSSVDHSYSSEHSEAMDYTVPLCQALRPASQDPVWLALRNMTHAAADGHDDAEEASESFDLDREQRNLSDFSMSSMDEDSFRGDATINLTKHLRRQSLAQDDLLRGSPDLNIEPISHSTPRPSISSPQPSSPPKPDSPQSTTALSAPSEFHPPSSHIPLRAKSTDSRPSSPSKGKAKQFTAAFAPPVSRPSPRKSTSPSKKRPNPSDDIENIDADRPSPAKRLAMADKWEAGSVFSNPRETSTGDGANPRPLSPSKRAPFQVSSSTASQAPSGLRRPSGYFARRKSFAVGNSTALNTSTRTSPKKKAGVGLGRASVGSGPADAWERFDKGAATAAPESVVDNPPPIEVDLPTPDDAPEPSVPQSSVSAPAPDVSGMDSVGFGQEEAMELDIEATEQWREGVAQQNFVEDEQPSMSIEQFMELTGVKFMDELTVPRRSIHPSQQLVRQARAPADIPLSEYAAAIGIDAPTLVLYTRVSQDLEAWMEKSRSDFIQAEEEATKVTPELFTEYAQADEEGQAELLHQLRLIRTNSRELGKSDWYGWKSKWIDGLLAAAQKTFTNLTSDANVLEIFNAQALTVLPDLEQEYDEILKELEKEKAEIVQLEGSDEQYLEELKASIAEQNLEVESLRSEVAESNEQVKWLQERVSELELEKQDTKEAIAKAEHSLNVHRNSTRAEVFRLKDELDALEDLHMFHVSKVTSELFEFVYASTLHISIPCKNFRPLMERVEISRLEFVKKRYKDDFPLLSRFLLSTAQRRLRERKGLTVRQIIHLVADFWSSCNQIRSQLRHLAVKYPVDVEVLPSSEGFAAKVAVLFSVQRAKAMISFVFDNETLSRWPVSIRSTRCDVEIEYGQLDSKAILNSVNGRLNQATPGDHHACLLDACIEAQESVQ